MPKYQPHYTNHPRAKHSSNNNPGILCFAQVSKAHPFPETSLNIQPACKSFRCHNIHSIQNSHRSNQSWRPWLCCWRWGATTKKSWVVLGGVTCCLPQRCAWQVLEWDYLTSMSNGVGGTSLTGSGLILTCFQGLFRFASCITMHRKVT